MMGTNLWQFGTNPAEGATFWDRTVKNREFWVLTGVDFAVSLAVGVAAAAAVGVVVLLGVTLTPAAAIVATAGVGLVIASLVDASGFPDKAKNWVNGLLGGE